jgi:hypothetical protein
MQGRKTIGALILTAMFVATALPVSAASNVNTEQQILWLKSNGTWGVSPLSQVVNKDGFETCSGISPLSNTCTLTDTGCISASFCAWTVGWFLPPDATGTGLLGGPAVMSTRVIMTSTGSSGVTDFECSWAGGSLFGFFGPPGLGVNCALYSIDFNVQGVITANFDNGAYDPHNLPFVGAGLPSTHSVPAAVGTWEALLEAFAF